ncbi:MAG: protein kinase [Gemmataceae bacterium]
MTSTPRPVEQSASEETFVCPSLDLIPRVGGSTYRLHPVAAVDPSPARVGHYQVVGPVGRGGMGVVYEGYDDRLKRRVAIKMIRDAAGPDQSDLLARFQTEAEAVAQLHHPNIVQIYQVGAEGGRPFVVLEFLPGGSLLEKTGNKPQPPREAAEVVRAVAAAMHHAHQHGVVHRDLKPANILFDAAGTPKVTDFGAARMTDAGRGVSSSLTRVGEVIGTPQFMAPEQAGGRPTGTAPAVDVYALGAVLYHLLTGRPPFDGPDGLDILRQVVTADPVPPSRLQPGVPRELETVCLKCLEKEPARRYPTAQALADDLARYLAGEPVKAKPASAIERLWKKARRRPTEAGLLVMVVAATVAGLAGVLVQWQAAEAARSDAEANAQSARVAETKAVYAKAAAETERDAAAVARATAAAALDSTRLALASDLWDKGEAAKAESLISADPPPGVVRDWEWHHVRGVFRPWLWEVDLAGASGADGPQWVRGLAASPDGRRVAVAAWDPYQPADRPGDTTLYLIRTADGRVERVWKAALKGQCYDLVWQSADRFVTRSQSQVIHVWDAAADRPVLTGPADTSPARDAHLSPDGTAAVVAVGPADLLVWDAVRGTAGPRLSVPGRRLSAEGIGGGTVACTDAESDLHCFDAATGVRRFTRPECGGLAGVSPDGRTLLTGRRHAGRRHTGTAAWDAHTGRPLWDRPADRTNVSRFQFTADGRYATDLAVDTGDVRVWTAAAGGMGYPLRGHQGAVNATALGPDGRLLATAGDDHTVRLWRLADGAPVQVLHGHRSGVRGVAFTWDAAGLITGGADGRVLMWDLTRQTPRHRAVLAPPGREYIAAHFGAMAFTPDGRLRLADTRRGLADYDPATVNPVGYRPVGTPYVDRYERDQIDWAFTPDGRRLVGKYPQTVPFLPRGGPGAFAAAAGGTAAGLPAVPGPRWGVAVWDGETGAELGRFSDLPGVPAATAVSPDGSKAAAYVNAVRPDKRVAGTVVVWDLAAGREVHRQPMPFYGAALAFSPDSRALVAAPDASTETTPVQPVRIDLATGTAAEWPAAGPLALRPLAFSPDGALLAGGCWYTGALIVWDTATRAVRWRADGVFTHLAFSPDGRRLAGTNYTGTVTLFEPGTGREVYSLPGQPGRLMDYAHPARLAFSHDGKHLAVNQHDGTVFVWEADRSGRRPPAGRGRRRPLPFHLRTATGRPATPARRPPPGSTSTGSATGPADARPPPGIRRLAPSLDRPRRE